MLILHAPIGLHLLMYYKVVKFNVYGLYTLNSTTLLYLQSHQQHKCLYLNLLGLYFCSLSSKCSVQIMRLKQYEIITYLFPYFFALVLIILINAVCNVSCKCKQTLDIASVTYKSIRALQKS